MSKRSTCEFGPCDRAVVAKGLCSGHYQQARSGGHLRPLRGQAANYGDAERDAEGRAILPCVECGEDRPTQGKGRCGPCYRKHRAEAMPECSMPQCDRKSKARGLCNSHYQAAAAGRCLERHPIAPRNNFGYGFRRVLASGNLEDVIGYIAEAAGGKDSNDCLNWPGSVTPQGYGRYSTTGNNPDLAHRIVASLAFGELGDMPVHHKCANRRCVNPDHLVPVTAAENNAEMMARKFYERRIEALENALREADPHSKLLLPVGPAPKAL